MVIVTSLGNVSVDGFTASHCRRNGHWNPGRNKELLDALSRNEFTVVKEVPSVWGKQATTNLVLVVKTSFATFLVILKRVQERLLMVTAYPARPRQLSRYAVLELAPVSLPPAPTRPARTDAEIIAAILG